MTIRMTQDEVEAYMSRFAAPEDPCLEIPDEGPEKRLQAKCLQYCQDQGYKAWHDWSRKKNKAGFPDLMIFMPEGRVRLVELKSAGRKLRKEQQEVSRHLLFLGHRVYVVRSFKRFLEVMAK